MQENIALLLSAALGALAAGLFGLLIERTKRHNEMLSIANAFMGEIKALLIKVEERKYIKILRRSSETGEFIQIPAKQNYFEVYQKNCDKIGILPARLTLEIAKFYIFAKAFVEDLQIYCSDYRAEYKDLYKQNYRELADLLEIINHIGTKVVIKVQALNKFERIKMQERYNLRNLGIFIRKSLRKWRKA